MKILLVSTYRQGQRLALLSGSRKDPEAFFYDAPKPLARLNSLFCGQVIAVRRTFALVDIGLERPAFLPHKRQSLTQGQQVFVQVTREEMEDLGERSKEPALDKGVQVSTHIVLSHRYIHFHPTKNDQGFSQGLSSASIERLRHDFQRQHCVTFRSAADNIASSEIKTAIDEMSMLYQSFSQASKIGLIQQGPTTLEKHIRDTPLLRIVVDDWATQALIKPYLWKEQEIEVKPHCFETFGMEETWETLLHPRVPIEGTAHMLFETTSGLTIIDINAGDNDPNTTNTKALPHLAQHLQWRNIGGNILVDFIPTKDMSYRHKILQGFKNHMLPATDVFGWSALGHLQLRRPLRTQPLWMKLGQPCQTCLGTGRIG